MAERKILRTIRHSVVTREAMRQFRSEHPEINDPYDDQGIGAGLSQKARDDIDLHQRALFDATHYIRSSHTDRFFDPHTAIEFSKNIIDLANAYRDAFAESPQAQSHRNAEPEELAISDAGKLNRILQDREVKVENDKNSADEARKAALKKIGIYQREADPLLASYYGLPPRN